MLGSANKGHPSASSLVGSMGETGYKMAELHWKLYGRSSSFDGHSSVSLFDYFLTFFRRFFNWSDPWDVAKWLSTFSAAMK